jgi:hypothetical protein
MKTIYVQKRRKALNPAFKRFQSLPRVAACKPPGGQFAIPPAVLLDRTASAALPAASSLDGLVVMRNE